MLRRGQALVVILLILGIAVTIGLSVVSRSVTEVNVSTGEEESARALEAAEAGVERALGGVVALGGVPVTDTLQESSFNVTNTASGGTTFYQVPYSLAAGEVTTIDLVGYGGSPANFRVCYGNGTGTVPAIEVMLYFDRGGIGVGRAGFAVSPLISNFQSAVSSVGDNCSTGSSFNYYAQFDLRNLGMLGGTPRSLRIRVFRNTMPQPVAVRAAGNLPLQGSEIISTGQAGGSTQKLRAIQSDEDLPFMFDSALFSGGDLRQP